VSQAQQFQVITLTYKGGVRATFTCADLTALISAGGGTPSQWSILLQQNKGTTFIVTIVADAATVTASQAQTVTAGINANQSFQTDGGSASLKTNQSVSSMAARFVSWIFMYIVVVVACCL